MHRPSKFGNKKHQLDGINFVSKAEAAYYWFHIKPKHDAGEITNLVFQPRIRCQVGEVKICDYVADFSYFDRHETGQHEQQGCQVVIEVKGYKTDVYKLKKKLVHALYPGLKIIEIPSKELRKEIAQLPVQEGKQCEKD